jgi:hypothetical protein
MLTSGPSRVFLVAASACLAACESSPPITEITLTGHDFSFTMPDTIAGGRVTLHFTNQGQEDHHAQLIRLNDGVTRAQFDSALAAVIAAVATEGDVAFVRLLQVATVAGGPAIVGPGHPATVTLDLAPGEYTLACFIASPGDGVSHLAKGMRRWLTVTAAPSRMPPAPAADGLVDMADFAFAQIPAMHSGPMTLEVTNSGQEPHEMAIVRLDGITLDQLMSMLMQPPSPGAAPAGPPPFTFVGGMQALMPGARGWVTLDLTPGTYAMLCFIPSPANQGKPHVVLGMVRQFTVN